MTVSISRAQFLSGSAKGGVALLAAGATLSQLADTAAAALPAADTAYVRLLVAAELQASDFYLQAVNAAVSESAVAKYLKVAYFNEQQHYQSVAAILSGEGVTPAVANDITFTYPANTFATQASIVSFAQQLEQTVLGTYLGAMSNIQTTSLLTGLSQIAACEAQHESYFATAMGHRAFSLSFPTALTQTEASNWFANYSS